MAESTSGLRRTAQTALESSDESDSVPLPSIVNMADPIIGSWLCILLNMWFSDPPNQERGRWGNSLGVRIPRGLAEEVGLGAGTEVSLTAKDGELVLRPAVPSDLVWLEFRPQAGSEQHGRRLALILSPKIYDGKVGLTLFCPIMSKIKGYPFEVKLPDGTAVIGVVLLDQLQSLDWRLRKVKFIERASLDFMAMVTARVLPLLEPDTPATL